VRVIAALLDGRSARTALRRSLPRGCRVVSCRSWAELDRALQHRLIDSIVLGTWAARRPEALLLCARYQSIPLVVAGAVRAEDAEPVLQWDAMGAAQLLVEGVDDSAFGERIARVGATERRLPLRAELPRLLRLSEPLQRRVWDHLAASAGRPPRPLQLARTLGVSREHLSRQFGAGGAPNLKRVSDLLTVQVALELLGNQGHDLAAVTRLLEFASPSHLRTTVRRVTGLGLAEARRAEWREVVRRFLRRSRG
jgi:AraC-like DNA-binding protein